MKSAGSSHCKGTPAAVFKQRTHLLPQADLLLAHLFESVVAGIDHHLAQTDQRVGGHGRVLSHFFRSQVKLVLVVPSMTARARALIITMAQQGEPVQPFLIILNASNNPTGWRMGWLVMPVAMTAFMGKRIEFNTSCAPVFVQRAGIAALEHADEVTPRVVAHLKACRDALVPALQALPGLELAPPKGGMYAFFKLPVAGDSLAIAKRLVQEAGLGLAPGNAFAPEANGWLRWCFASKDMARLHQGVERQRGWLESAPLRD